MSNKCHYLFSFAIALCGVMGFARPTLAYSLKNLDGKFQKIYLEILKHKKPVNTKDGLKIVPATPGKKLARLTFLWASWCESCDAAIGGIRSFKTPENENRLEIVSICVDGCDSKEAKFKTSKMIGIEQFSIGTFFKQMPAELSRLPVFFVENMTNGEFNIYTGFSTERLQIIEKNLMKIFETTRAGDSSFGETTNQEDAD